MAKDATDMIEKVLVILFGLVLLPIIGSFVAIAALDANISSIVGAAALLSLIVIAVLFGLVLRAVKGMRGN